MFPVLIIMKRCCQILRRFSSKYIFLSFGDHCTIRPGYNIISYTTNVCSQYGALVVSLAEDDKTEVKSADVKDATTATAQKSEGAG